MFKIDDIVRYGTNGVCKITDITVKSFCGEDLEYYVLCPVTNKNNTFFVPVSNERLVARMQYILSSGEIHSIIEHIDEYAVEWISDDKERRAKFGEIIERGNRREIIGLIRTLYSKRAELDSLKKKMHLSDERLMYDAERMINDEFSAVLGILPAEVPEFIRQKLDKSRV